MDLYNYKTNVKECMHAKKCNYVQHVQIYCMLIEPVIYMFVVTLLFMLQSILV